MRPILDFTLKLSQVIDLLCPRKKLRLKASSKPWIDSETILVICKRDKLFKKYRKFGLEAGEDNF